MSIVVTYLAYLLISIGLTFVTGRVLSRSGRLFLADALDGSESAARGISNLIVVSFYLISLGFVALTMRTSSDAVSARQALQLLASKVGLVLLVLGALYLAGIVTLTRLRRRLRAQQADSLAATAQSTTARSATARSAIARSTTPEPTVPSASAGTAGLSGAGLWHAAARKVAQ